MTWDGVDRRKARHRGEDPVTNDDLDDALSAALQEHSKVEREYVDKLVSNILKAFPSEDVAGHHDYHDRKIKAAIAEEEFWHTAKQEMVKAGVNGMLKVLWLVVCLAALGLTVKFTMPEAMAKVLIGVVGK